VCVGCPAAAPPRALRPVEMRSRQQLSATSPACVVRWCPRTLVHLQLRAERCGAGGCATRLWRGPPPCPAPTSPSAAPTSRKDGCPAPVRAPPPPPPSRPAAGIGSPCARAPGHGAPMHAPNQPTAVAGRALGVPEGRRHPRLVMRVQIMGWKKCRIVGKYQSVRIMINDGGRPLVLSQVWGCWCGCHRWTSRGSSPRCPWRGAPEGGVLSSCTRSILTEIYLHHACSCQEIEFPSCTRSSLAEICLRHACSWRES
jgi:hypothetical protein